MHRHWHTDSLTTLESSIWGELSAAIARPGAAWRTPVVSSGMPDGSGVDARVMVLRAADRIRRELVAYTDARSPKVEAWRRSQSVSWTFYDPGLALQLRVQGVAEVHRNDSLASAVWSTVPEANRLSYRTRAAPGTSVESPPDGHDFIAAVLENFAVLVTRVWKVDWLWLDASGHRRAQFTYQPGQASHATWLVP
jgi:pyridoxamine 5'-phosphate oxidase